MMESRLRETRVGISLEDVQKQTGDLNMGNRRFSNDNWYKSHVFHAGIRATLVLFVVTMIWLNLNYKDFQIDAEKEYGKVLSTIFTIIVVIPYLSLPVTVASCVGILGYNPYEKICKPNYSLTTAPFICFRVVTRGDYPDLVRKNVEVNEDICLRLGLANFAIEVVSDAFLGLPVGDHIREIVVPYSYETKRKTRFKARALNYCLEDHVNTLANNDWIVHLDEETVLSERAVHGILGFIAENRADIGQGPISYANNKVIQNWITTLADNVRLAFDYSLFRCQFSVLHRPVFGFKGSYIVLRSGTELDVGLDFGPNGSIAEDCYFALLAWKRGYTFDFIPGEMRENSPLTATDYIRQRRRWFVGQLYTVLSKEIPLQYKMTLILSVTSCILMPLGISNIAINIFFPFTKPLTMKILTGFIGGTFAFLYAFGTYKSFATRGWSYRKLISICLVACIFIIPAAAILESIATFWGLFTLNSKEFFVIKKEGGQSKQTVHGNGKGFL